MDTLLESDDIIGAAVHGPFGF